MPFAQGKPKRLNIGQVCCQPVRPPGYDLDPAFWRQIQYPIGGNLEHGQVAQVVQGMGSAFEKDSLKLAHWCLVTVACAQVPGFPHLAYPRKYSVRSVIRRWATSGAEGSISSWQSLRVETCQDRVLRGQAGTSMAVSLHVAALPQDGGHM